jgi:beta-glucosidase
MTGDKGYKLKDVKEGKITLDQFVAQLDLDELEAISRGDYKMDSPLGARGNAGAIGGVLQSLREKGVPPMITTDGPSGIRLLAYCSLIPIGTAFACSWNTALVKDVYTLISKEMKEKGSDILLAPGMNIHRSPLCGRNFEYFSEDPVLSGLMAAATVEGIQAHGGSACPKHFACNNQETNRTHTDSRLSERALREIYLKGFEICVKKAKPNCIMTSYNKINGVWGHYNYELCQRILREEWGFEGLVMTDWWMRYSNSPEFPLLKDNGYRVRSSVDVLMPGGKRTGKSKPDGTLLETFGKTDGITSGEMQRTAMRVLNLCLDYID